MKKITLILLSIATFVSCTKESWQNKAIRRAEYQLLQAAEKFKSTNKIPRTLEKNGDIRLVGPRDWTSGFFAGSLWYTYQLTGNKDFLPFANHYTFLLKDIQNYNRTHDVGFMINCSYGNALKSTNNEDYKKVIIQTAETLSTRFNGNIGCIKSWSWGKWQFPVIIDNMMNLELLFDASKFSGNPKYKNIAIAHANTTMQNHFRSDNSSYHVVDYDTTSFKAVKKQTWQGYADESSWSRGQAWGLYGYTVCYRETKDKKYLEQAKNIAKFIIDNESMPTDKVLYWDFNAPDIPNATRDASAAAITASALLELSKYSTTNKKKYYGFAEQILKSLSTDEYLAQKDSNKLFVLKHSTGAYTKDVEIDVPLNYADYYFLEAMYRYKMW